VTVSRASAPTVPLTYLDHAATTPMRPEARAALDAWLDGPTGNPSGSHRAARAARRALDDARDTMAAVLGCGPGDVVFTGGGTEADNLAVLGTHAAAAASGASGAARTPTTVVCSAFEHHAVLHATEAVPHRLAAVGRDGRVDLDALAALLDDEVALVSVMTANNEVGTIQPLAEVAELVRARAPRAVLHSDAVAAFPWVDVAVVAADADLVSVSAHKFGGPQGVGALAVKAGVALRARAVGGGQERDRRSGTQNVAGIMAMAAAAEATAAQREATVESVGKLRDGFVDGLLVALDGVVETVPERRDKVAGSAHLCFEGVDSEALLFLLDEVGVCASAASSCASGALQVSHVLGAMGVERSLAAGSVRFSLGWPTTAAEVAVALDAVVDAVGRLRGRR
jgi:cysteine desulfurase